MTNRQHDRRLSVRLVAASIAISTTVSACQADDQPTTSPSEIGETVAVPEIVWSAGDPRLTDDAMLSAYFSYQVLFATAATVNNFSDPRLAAVAPIGWLDFEADSTASSRWVHAGPLPSRILDTQTATTGDSGSLVVCIISDYR